MINEQSEFMQSRIMLAVLLIPHCHQLLQLMRHHSQCLNTKHSPHPEKTLVVGPIVNLDKPLPFNPLTSWLSVFSPACLFIRAGRCMAELPLLCLQHFPSDTVVNVQRWGAAASLLWRRGGAVLHLPSSSASLTLLQFLLQTLVGFASSIVSVNKRWASVLGVRICRDWSNKKATLMGLYRHKQKYKQEGSQICRLKNGKLTGYYE